MKSTLRPVVAATLLLVPVAATFVAQPAQAATRAATQPHIASVNLNSDAGLSPGATLRVTIAATPDASDASVALGNSGVRIPLRQESPGKYTGSYTVRHEDHIDPMQRMVARLDLDGRAVSREFNYPPAFQALAMGAGDQRNSARVARRDDDGESMARDERRDEHMDRDERVAREERRDEAMDRDARANRYDGPPAGLPLQVMLPGNDMAIDANGDVAIQGRTVPYANVRVRVDSVANVAGLGGVTQPVADLNVQADRNGLFTAVVPPRPGVPLPGTRFRVRVTANSGNQSVEERLTLVQRQG